MEISYFVFLAIAIVLQIMLNVTISNKVDATLTQINAEVVSLCVDQKSILTTYESLSVDTLALDQRMLKEYVGIILEENIKFASYTVDYIFYDKTTLDVCPIDVNECNSVQIKITLSINNKEYEGALRYEPMEY